MKYFICLVFILLAACESRPQNHALGTLERNRISHAATANEVIVSLPVAQGAIIKKGTLLVKLDDSLQIAQVNKAAAEVAEADSNLEKLRNGARIEDVAAARAKVESVKAILVESEIAYARSKELIKSNTISQSTLDKDRAFRDNSRGRLKNAREELLKLTNGTRVEDLRIAAAQLEAANATLANEKKQLADLSVIATRDGILDSLPWNLGERVTIGSPLAIVLAGKAPFARIYVPEPYRVKLKVGDQLTIHVDGLQESLTGSLRWISSEPAFTPYYALNQEERARLMYLAEVQLPDSEAQLPNGVPVQVELP